MTAADVAFKPPAPPWTPVAAQAGAGSYVSVYLSSDIARLPVRDVTRLNDNKSDPNLETGTYASPVGDPHERARDPDRRLLTAVERLCPYHAEGALSASVLPSRGRDTLRRSAPITRKAETRSGCVSPGRPCNRRPTKSGPIADRPPLGTRRMVEEFESQVYDQLLRPVGVEWGAIVDPVSLVVMALAAGAAAGLKPTAEAAVRDAYAGLKAFIRGRYDRVDLAALEQKPASATKRASLAEDLEEAGAAADGELLERARSLVELLRSHEIDAAPVGVDLERVSAAFLTVSKVSSAGTGVRVRDGEFSGGINIGEVQAGQGGDRREDPF